MLGIIFVLLFLILLIKKMKKDLCVFNLGVLIFLMMIEFKSFIVWESYNKLFMFSGLSYGLVMLSFWISLLMVMGGGSVFKMNLNWFSFVFVILFLLLILVMSFITNNFLLFYVFFECSLIPTFLLILGWGYQSERIQAGVYLMMYTVSASLPLLGMIYYYYFNLFSLNLVLFDYLFLDLNFYGFFFFTLAFLVKLPMFLVHLWLPSAHVEAPVSGSMILAGVLLKLGGYGLLQVMRSMWRVGNDYALFYISLSLIGGVLISLVCLRQSDLKLLVAYSSVCHMGLMMSGVFTFKSWGVMGSFSMMVSHGLCSSGLFYLCNLTYERSGSRNLLFNKGMLHYLPKLSLWWFLFCVMNMAAPPSLNLFSEICLINSLVCWSDWTMILLMLMGFLAACYSLYMFSYSQHGKLSSFHLKFTGVSMSDYLILGFHWIPLNVFVLNFDYWFSWL
uniref:NADH-ubiquinone oxidoreductase chain 4 n=1 Tax=Archipsocus nomas TaxID=239250 RepID=A0A343QCF6_9NEOP|nr:NADH dehydrogenase subunit 4 [Archipsocus nomas]ATU07103.1 NADH dehydrogenase subunit 4 [Archipsocus nomas]